MNHVRAVSRMGRTPMVLVSAAGFLALGGCATLTGARPAPVTVGQIVKWSQEGMPPQDIINLRQDSGTAYRLSASQLPDLQQKKRVCDGAINYMPQTYLKAVRGNQARRDFAGKSGRFRSIGNPLDYAGL